MTQPDRGPDAAAAAMIVAPDDPRAEDVRALLERHLTFARTSTPPEDVFALDVSGLCDDGITFVSARRAGELLGVGALKHLDGAHAELKSMHTAHAARRQGVGRIVVEHLLALARERGYRRVSLETGNLDVFAPARALYSSLGFQPCAPFGPYVDSRTSACMTIDLDAGRTVRALL
jgi:putative acetyltransferase